MIDQGKHTDPGSPSTSQATTGSAGNGSLNPDKAKQQGRETAHEVSEAAHQQAENLFSQQRDNAAEQAGKFSSVFQKMADEFDNQQQPYFSEKARKLADTTDRFTQNLRNRDLQSICNDAQSYSRREPALFIGGAIAAGFLVSRFLRSSSQHQSASGSQPGTVHSGPALGGTSQGSSTGTTQGPGVTVPGSSDPRM
ncbi:hypothetical protein R5M92_09025 [Halomonas sp. Bachu 37]|uniref:hypothetical protein n=1 Tax=Halomonas kashgarensis TaxID=3084920 RepID=UPI003216C93B